jgi:hypothetical protein
MERAQRDAVECTASVAGTFAYTPPSGTVLNAGAGQTLSVVHANRRGELHRSDGGRASWCRWQHRPHVADTGGNHIWNGFSATQLNATANVPGTRLAALGVVRRRSVAGCRCVHAG